MNILLPVIAAGTLLVASASSPARPDALDQPGYDVPAQPWPSIEAARSAQNCRDRIEHARAAAGKPELDRRPADADKPLLVYAVDKRVDGCGVLVPVADPTDLRPLPENKKGPLFRRIPTR